MIKGILLLPNGDWRDVELPEDPGYEGYKLLNELVGGWIEAVGLPNGVGYINEEGKILGMAYNMPATAIAKGNIAENDWIAGNMVVFGKADRFGEETDIPDDLARKCKSWKTQPEE